jgi:death-on-curing protein
VIFLDLDELLHVAAAAMEGKPVVIRDVGLLESALNRPQTTAFGKDAYDSDCDKCAALIHSLARNHGLVDGNKRLALGAGIAFLGMNGLRLTFTEDAAYDFIFAIAEGELDDVPSISALLAANTQLRYSLD